MVELELLRSLGVMLLAALGVVLVARTVRVPNIVAYIGAGLLLGPALGVLTVTHTIELIAEFGIILLLFLVGLELSLDKIKAVGATAFVTGGVQMGGTALGGGLLAGLFGVPVVEAVVVAVAIMFSSTVVVVKMLEKQSDLDAPYGQIAVGVLLVQDLVVVMVLTFVAGLAGPGELAWADVARGLGQAFVGMALLGGLIAAAARYVLPPAIQWISRMTEGLFIWSLFWCFLVVLGAEALHLSPELGAFLAGIALAQLPQCHELRQRVHPLMNFFIIVFFVSLGLQMELGAALARWPLALALAAFVMVVKPLLFFGVLPRLGHGEETSFRTGLSLAQISEFSLIFGALALSSGLIDEALLSVITLVGLVTFALSSFLLLYSDRLYAAVKPYRPLAWLGARQEAPVPPPDGLQGHVIVVGLNTLGRCLVDRLTAAGETVVAVDTDPEKLARRSVFTVHGNAVHETTREAADWEDAKLVVSSLSIEGTNNLLAYHARRAGVPCSIHAFDRTSENSLRTFGVDHLIRSKHEGARRLLDELKSRAVLS
ncbi:Kef-type K+ transport system membrane component KefB [Salinibacter ruber]|uniref:cation:proton antiporter domain-containing protein n=1 Tax=Salinibacter ruber TaxID=146919 RepID=UPI002167A456|nr:cation:proton antiporter [Salinibacter ruber]MCS3649286.1 Kef-type K+ transport system membrane component KefB [Salinibacter ruber]MCS3652540.1 Kef-type K+ transport system membrane component KefB [Salinibacter ruber]